MYKHSKKTSQNLLFQPGFTLVELMVVVAIIGILAALAIPQFQKFLSKSKRTEGLLLVDSLHKTELSYFATSDVFLIAPGSWLGGTLPSRLGFDAPSSKFYNSSTWYMSNFTAQTAGPVYAAALSTFGTSANGIDSDPTPDVLCVFFPASFSGFNDKCCNEPENAGKALVLTNDIAQFSCLTGPIS